MGYIDMQDVKALWQTMRFTPAQLVFSNLNIGCTGILLCSEYVPLSTSAAHMPHPSNPNHWFLVLVLANGVRLRLEVTPSVFPLAFVKVDSAPAHLCRNTPNPRELFWLVLRMQDPHLIVMDILHTLITNGVHQFSFTNNGRGARHWLRCAVFHLEAANILDNGSLESVDEVIHKKWWRGAVIGEAPVVPGSFYACYGCETHRHQYCDHEQTYPWAMAGMRRRKRDGV